MVKELIVEYLVKDLLTVTRFFISFGVGMGLGLLIGARRRNK